MDRLCPALEQCHVPSTWTRRARSRATSSSRYARPRPHLDVAHLEFPLPWERLPSLQRYDVLGVPPGGRTPSPRRVAAELRMRASCKRRPTRRQERDHRLLDARIRPFDGDRHCRSRVAFLRDPESESEPQQPGRDHVDSAVREMRGTPASGGRTAVSIDIVPTIADVMGVKIPGRSTATHPRAEGEPSDAPALPLDLAHGADRVTPSQAGRTEIPGDAEYDGAARGVTHLGKSGAPDFPHSPTAGSSDSRLADHHGTASTRTAAVARRTASRRSTSRHPPSLGLEPDQPSAPTPMWLAVAVNHHIAAVTTLPGTTADARFTFLIPPSLARQGNNRAELFEITARPPTSHSTPYTHRRSEAVELGAGRAPGRGSTAPRAITLARCADESSLGTLAGVRRTLR